MTITSENVILDEEFCRSRMNAHPGEYVKISIADTGVGIDKKHIDRIYEPFFSTKGVRSCAANRHLRNADERCVFREGK